VAVGNVYPITRSDYGSNASHSDFYDSENGLSLKPCFDSHCCCVRAADSYQASTKLDDLACVDELVVKEAQQVLPRYIVYFKNQ